MRHKLINVAQDLYQDINVLRISVDCLRGESTSEVSMSGVMGTSSTAEPRSSINELISVYVFECRKACRSEGDTIRLVGTT
jgi:hypothetical protein